MFSSNLTVFLKSESKVKLFRVLPPIQTYLAKPKRTSSKQIFGLGRVNRDMISYNWMCEKYCPKVRES